MLLFRHHPRIVKLKSPYLHLSLKDCSIYMEFASEGTLDKMISNFGGKALPDNFIGRFTRMMLEGLEALHARDYVHCDLKPANILLFPSTTFGEPYNLKLADFGQSKKSNTYSRSGTETYMPPESFESDGVIRPAFDIWSLGCVVFEMFGGKPIKMENSDSYVWRLYQDISPVAISFLRRCHTWDPLRRASTTELLNHPFITQWPTRKLQEMIPKLPGSIW